MNTLSEVPRHIRVDREGGWLEIEWADGSSGRITLERLRQQCPCALCDSLRARASDSGGLHMVSPDEVPSSELRDVIPVGTYAIQIRWADDHDTGIYRYPYLKEILGKLDAL